MDIMARLSISLLGCFDVLLEGKRVTNFEANKARALLAYLVVEANRPHHRASLAALLWPDYPAAKARNNLRQTLYRVRHALAEVDVVPPHLFVTNRDIQFNNASDYWLDADEFRRHTSEFLHRCSQSRIPSDAHLKELEATINLYQGDFLAGLHVANAPQFEGWLLSYQESFHHLALEVLTKLAEIFELRQKFAKALHYSKRAIELEPWFETSHRQLIRLLALSGQRHAALRQFEECRRILAQELGVEPTQETTRLLECVRDGTLLDVECKSHAFDNQKSGIVAPILTFTPGDTPFVARESELAQLHCHLEAALANQGHLVFVKGESGSGKTRLMGEFASQTMREHANVLVAAGNCGALTGNGCFYLPFLEILSMLCGCDGGKRLTALNSDIASRRLRLAFPDVLQALVESGPDLLGTMVQREPLFWRTPNNQRVLEDFLRQRRGLLKKSQPSKSWIHDEPGIGDGQLAGNWPVNNSPEDNRIGLYDQVAQVMISLSSRWPLLLMLDDLQWIDRGSLNLLFHLVRLASCSPILILAAYRPEDIARGRKDERHPLEQVIHELKQRFGEIEIDLDDADGRQFIDAFLDTEPNRLSENFIQTLYQHTGGQPMFTVELLRVMQESGDLVQDDQAFWVSTPSLDWDRLPPRVDAAIAERVSRVSEFSREILSAASVQGVTFVSEVIAKVLGAHESQVARRLSSELSRQHRLVRALYVEHSGDLHLSKFQFRHHLYQKYLYQNLDDVERVHFQQITDEVLEKYFSQHSDETSLPEAGESIFV